MNTTTSTTSTRDLVARILYSAVAELDRGWEGPAPEDENYPIQGIYAAWTVATRRRKQRAEAFLKRCAIILGGEVTYCDWNWDSRRWTERSADDLNVDTATAWIRIPGIPGVRGAAEPLGDGEMAMLAFQAAGRLKSLARELDISDSAAQDLHHALGWYAIDMLEVPAPFNGHGLKKAMDEAGW